MDEKLRKARIKQFLDVTKDIESSGGKNFDHTQMKSGIHKGHSAIGSYGLMPNTIKEFSNRLGTPELKQLSDLSPEEMRAQLESNPELENKIIEPIAGWMLDKYKDPRVANYAYQYGHNLPEDKIRERMKGSDRDMKFLERYKEPIAIEEETTAEQVDNEPPTMFKKIKEFFTK